jgi:hypothetical protein
MICARVLARSAYSQSARDQPDIRVIVTASRTGGLRTITRMIRRYTSPKGGVIFDHPYNADLARCSVPDRHIGTPGVRVAYGARTLELNLAPSEVSSLFDEFRLGPASELVPAWVDEVMYGGPQG